MQDAALAVAPPFPEPLATAPPPAAPPEVALAARRELTFLLELAYSGELGAAWAYIGHARSVRDPGERAHLARIAREEVRHRQCLLRMLRAVGGGPDPRRERKLTIIGHLIAFFCRVGGWFFPMYGAGKLEAQNIREYEHAARLAWVAGIGDWVDPLLEMAEVEWDHELFFRERAQGHALWRWMPRWRVPPPRSEIRASFDRFREACERGEWHVETVHAPLLIR